MTVEFSVELGSGKYTYERLANGEQRAARYGNEIGLIGPLTLTDLISTHRTVRVRALAANQEYLSHVSTAYESGYEHGIKDAQSSVELIAKVRGLIHEANIAPEETK